MTAKDIYYKGKKRLGKILGRIIPYNTRYRPADVCRININDTSSLNQSEINLITIYPKLTTTLNISENLFQACSDYRKPERSITTDYVVIEVPNGRIYTENESSVAVISKYNRLIENVSLNLSNATVTGPDLNNIFEQRYFTVPTKLKGTVFSLLTGGAGLNNISHWFVDVLPRLHLLKKSGLYNKVDWFLFPSIKYDYQRETIEMLNIPLEKVITGDQYPHLVADCIIASTAPRGNSNLVPKWLCNYIRKSFLEDEALIGTENKEEDSPYIYISRSDSKIRNVSNEAELLKALEPYNFKCIRSSDYSIKEKIKMFSKAKVVISPTGAGLINMIFCKPGTKVIEIFNEDFVVEPFYDIAEKVELDYNYIICKGNGRGKNIVQGQRQDLKVEVEKLIEVVDELIEQQKKPSKKSYVHV